MKERLVRVAGPAVLVVLEVEAPTRLLWATANRAEEDRLAVWIAASRARSDVITAALADRDLRGGELRASAWSRELLGDGDGVVGALESLLRER